MVSIAPKPSEALTFEPRKHQEAYKPIFVAPHINLAMLDHFENKLKRYQEKSKLADEHYNLLHKQLKILTKKSSDSQNLTLDKKTIEKIAEIIQKLITFLENFKNKKIDRAKEHQLDLENLKFLPDFSLSKLLSDHTVGEIKEILQNQIDIIIEHKNKMENKREEANARLKNLVKQTLHDANRLQGEVHSSILERIQRVEQIIEDGVTSLIKIITDKIFHSDKPTEGDEAQARLNPKYPAAVFNANHKSKLPGTKVFDNTINKESQLPSLEEAVNAAYSNTKQVLNFWDKVLGLNMKTVFPGNRADATIHYLKNYVNAFFDGVRMVYGDGNKYFQGFWRHLMIAGHEMGHAIVELNYFKEAGALNESYADIFGASTDMYTLGITDPNDYHFLVGKDLVSYKGKTYPLRRFQEGPAYENVAVLGGSDPQPDKMPPADWYLRNKDMLDQDNGGVHILSKIPNRVFYMIATEQKDWQAPVLFWKRVLDQIDNPNITFAEFAALQIHIANDENNPALVAQLQKAWTTVGVTLPKSALETEVQNPSEDLPQLVAV